MMKTALVLLVALGLAGCAGSGGISQAIYGGLQIREEIVNPAPAGGAPPQRPLSYEQYEKERLRLLDERTTK